MPDKQVKQDQRDYDKSNKIQPAPGNIIPEQKTDQEKIGSCMKKEGGASPYKAVHPGGGKFVEQR